MVPVVVPSYETTAMKIGKRFVFRIIVIDYKEDVGNIFSEHGEYKIINFSCSPAPR